MKKILPNFSSLKQSLGLGFILIVAVLLITLSFNISNYKINAEEVKKDKKENTLTVEGKGIINAEPDIAYLDLTIKTTDFDVKKSQSDNSEKTKKVIDELTKLKIEKKNIQTTNFNIYEDYDWSNEERVFKGYVVENTITVKITNIDKVAQVLEKSIASGANLAGRIVFDVEDKENLYNQALKNAMSSAEKKATSIMSTFGAKPSKPYKIQEGYSSIDNFKTKPDELYKSKEALSDASGEIQTGSLTIRATVTVEYKY